jgi:DNA-binding NtrC family response regulator
MKPAVLIAEDDAELCGVYQKFITERGYSVETASDGLDCPAKLRRAMPTVVVLGGRVRLGITAPWSVPVSWHPQIQKLLVLVEQVLPSAN